MKTNYQILNEIASGSNKVLDAMKEAQIEALYEVLNRYGADEGSVLYSIINEIKEELT